MTSQRLVCKDQGREERRHVPGKSSPSSSSRVFIPYENPLPWLGSSGIPPKIASSLHQGTSAQSSTTPIEHKAPGLQPTPAAFSETIHRERPTKQDPDDIIDLTLDSSDVEFFDTKRIRPNEPSIHGFSKGSTIIGPALNLPKESHDKPRSFVRYKLDFEPGLVSVSAHGFVDQISMAPRW